MRSRWWLPALALALPLAPLPAQLPQPLGDLRPGSAASSGTILGPGPRAGETLFLADDGVHGWEVWTTDGTPSGTRMLADMTPGAAGTAVLALSSAAGVALIRTGLSTSPELWVTDGTPAGTSRLLTVSMSTGMTQFADLVAPGIWTFGIGGVLWRTDGTLGGTWSLAVPWGSAVGTLGTLTVLQGAQGALIATDGSGAATIGALPGQVRQLPDGRWLQMRTMWTGQTSVAAVRWLDGPGSPTLAFVGQGAQPFPLPNGFLFVTGLNQKQLLFWDGIQSMPVGPSFASVTNFHRVGDEWWFQGDDLSVNGRELWITDGTPLGTRVVDFVPGPASSTPLYLGNLGAGAIYWIDTPGFGSEPWFVDGTLAGSFRLQDLEPGPGSSQALAMMEGIGGQRRRLVAAWASAQGWEPWATDGTVTGSGFVADLRPGTDSSLATFPPPFAIGNAVGDAALFFADDGVTGTEPWLLPLPGSTTPLRTFGATRIVTGDPVFGTTMPIEVAGLATGSLGAVVLGQPDPAGLLLSPGQPLHVAAGSATVPAVFVGGAPWTGSLVVPNVPAALGLDAVLQVIESDAAAPFGWRAGSAVWLSFGW